MNSLHHIFLSPHLDDAIACCGGTMAHLVATSQLVTVYNIFCGFVCGPFSKEAESFHIDWGNPPDIVRLRRAEDLAAAARIGADVIFQGLPEALYRRSIDGSYLYESPNAIFQTQNSNDAWIINYLITALSSRFRVEDVKFYAPMGIGNHIDHLLVTEVAQHLVNRGFRVWLYEDFPYALNLHEYNERILCFSKYNTEIQLFDEKCLQLKVDAFSYYHSQIPMLFSNSIRMSEAFRSFASTVANQKGYYGERYWYIP